MNITKEIQKEIKRSETNLTVRNDVDKVRRKVAKEKEYNMKETAKSVVKLNERERSKKVEQEKECNMKRQVEV